MSKLPFFKSANIPDLTTLTLEELTQLHTHVGKHLVERKEARIKALQAELRSLGVNDGPVIVGNGKSAGPKASRKTQMPDGAIVGRGSPAKANDGGKTRAKPGVKYKDDKGNTWTGRGGTPKWLATYEAQGKSRDKFLA